MAALLIELADRLERRSLHRQEQLEGKNRILRNRGRGTQEPTRNSGVWGTQRYFAEGRALNSQSRKWIQGRLA